MIIRACASKPMKTILCSYLFLYLSAPIDTYTEHPTSDEIQHERKAEKTKLYKLFNDN